MTTYTRVPLFFFSVILLFGLSGCVATRNWVAEQMAPLTGRVTEGETRMTEMGGKVTGLEGRLGQTDARLGQTDAKADKALQSLANLKLERRFVLDMKEGANFAFNKAGLTDEAKREIDGFLSDLKGDVKEGEGVIFLIAGHTDGAGSEEYNYDLGRKRADAVARHMIVAKKVDPLRVMTVSYGENAPLAENTSKDGRKKNRRVEILVYKEGITSSSGADSRADAQQAPSDQRITSR